MNAIDPTKLKSICEKVNKSMVRGISITHNVFVENKKAPGMGVLFNKKMLGEAGCCWPH